MSIEPSSNALGANDNNMRRSGIVADSPLISARKQACGVPLAPPVLCIETDLKPIGTGRASGTHFQQTIRAPRLSRPFTWPTALVVVLLLPLVSVARGDDESTAQALAAVDRFMSTFNSADMAEWAKTLNYPHVRIASDSVKVWQTPKDYLTSFDFDALRKQYGWDHSAFDYKKVIHASKNKVHVTVQFTRYRADKSKIATYQALYVVTRQDGHWGIQARSSFAP